MSINTVAARLGLSVHQLRRWELMFGLEIKRGRGQQRQYRPEDMTILERIKELVEQGWPTSQIRPQIEAEGLITPKLIGMPNPPGNPEVVLESLIGMRTFCERRFIELSRQIDELRQLIISLSLRQDLAGEGPSPWQPVEHKEMTREEAKPILPPQEIAIGPEVKVAVSDVAASAIPQEAEVLSLGEITDQNYLTVLGRALDLIGWTDEEADEYAEKTFGVPHWDELGRSQTEKLVAHLVSLMNEDKSVPPVVVQTSSGITGGGGAAPSTSAQAGAAQAAQSPDEDLDEYDEPEEEVATPQPAHGLPQPAQTVGSGYASSPYPQAGQIYPGQGMPQPAQALPQPAQALPQPAQSIPQPAQSLPQPGQIMSQPAQIIPQPAQAIPQPAQTIPQPAQTIPQPAQVVPQPVQNYPQTQPSYTSPAPTIIPPPAPLPQKADEEDYFFEESDYQRGTENNTGFGVTGGSTKASGDDDYSAGQDVKNPPSPPFEPPA